MYRLLQQTQRPQQQEQEQEQQCADIRLKIVVDKKDDIRRYSISRDQFKKWSRHEALQWIVSNCVEDKNNNNDSSRASFSMMYMDEEGDWCTVQNDMEWQEAVRIACESPIFRLKLITTYSENREQHRFHHFYCPQIRTLSSGPAAAEDNSDGKFGWHPRRRHRHRIMRHIPPPPPPPPPRTDDSNNAEKDPIHYGIICDGCNQHPLRGTRHRCTICKGRGYDLCSKCFESVDKLHHHEADKFEILKEPAVPFLNRRRIPTLPPRIKVTMPSPTSPPSAVEISLPKSPVLEKKDEVHQEQQVQEEEQQAEQQDVKQEEEAQEERVHEQEQQEEEEQVPEQNAPTEEELIEGELEEQSPPVTASPQITSPYAKHLSLIREMGFTDDERSIALLKKYRGNLQRVLNAYLG